MGSASRKELNMLMIQKLYGKHYEIIPLYVAPSDQGHTGVARDRVYVILWLRDKVVMTADPKKLYQDKML